MREVPDFDVTEFTSRATRYCVVVPLINEDGRIARQLDRMAQIAELPDLILADGGSTDGSTDIERLANAGVGTLLVKRGQGRLGAQLRMGFAHALDRGYEGVITVDGNDKDGVEAIPTFVAALDRGVDFAQGSRFVEGGVEQNTPWLRRLAIRLVHSPAVSRAAGFRYTDTTNGFRGYSRRLLEHPKVDLFRSVFAEYELLPYLAVRAAQIGMSVCEIPVRRTYPLNSPTPTKISKVSGNIQILSDLWKITRGRFDPD